MVSAHFLQSHCYLGQIHVLKLCQVAFSLVANNGICFNLFLQLGHQLVVDLVVDLELSDGALEGGEGLLPQKNLLIELIYSLP